MEYSFFEINSRFCLIMRFSLESKVVEIFMIWKVIVYITRSRLCCFSILWCSWSGDYPWDNLTKLDYKLDIKVGKNKTLLYSWLLIGPYQKKLGILKLGKFEPFFLWKILFITWNHIFKIKIWQNFTKKNLS
jgi:hypothetical protein